ncbi:MAG TPA: methyltransferase domain-containing protein [Candidatus Binataceae bacterium]|nr:methyltransferase domain-containing protein [Candidatus Binataceae bacterium]
MTFGRYAIAHAGGKAVMIPGAAPGDLLDLELISQHRDYAVARVVRVVRKGPCRREAPCEYAATCGGCDWQHIDYDAQVALKGELVASEFRRTLGIELDPRTLVEPSPTEFGYRSRIRLQTGPGGKLGFHRAGSNSLVEIERCLVSNVDIDPAAELARTIGRKCREIEIVEGQKGRILVAELAEPPGPGEINTARSIVQNRDGIAGVILRAGAARAIAGEVQVAIEVEPGCVLEGDADHFSQVNRAQNRRLVAAVIELASLSPGMRMLDLFCGAGNFSLPAARRGAVVTGVDANAFAIEAARANAARMGLAGIQFISMRAAETARFLATARYPADIVTLDPPRSGAADLMEPVAKLGPSGIIYVSCDPSTMVRDLLSLARSGYMVSEVRAFDFFPNTHHVEVVARVLLT